MINLNRTWITGLAGCVALAGAFGVGRVWASGIPTSGTLTYTGSLANPDGTPVIAASKNIGITVYDAATAGTIVPECTVASGPVGIALGQFQIQLPDTCSAKIQATPNLWIDVTVDGGSLGRTKLGAVPYAVEAGHAVNADAATNSAHATAADSATGALAAAMTAVERRVSAIEGLVHSKSGFRAWLSGAGPLISNTGTVEVAFDTEDFDLTDEYDTTSGVFTPKQDGAYLINCGFWFVSSAAGMRYNAQIFRNGIANTKELSGFDAQTSSAGGVGISVETTTVAKLTAGDKITCGAGLSGSAQNVAAGLSGRNRFGAMLLN